MIVLEPAQALAADDFTAGLVMCRVGQLVWRSVHGGDPLKVHGTAFFAPWKRSYLRLQNIFRILAKGLRQLLTCDTEGP